MAPVIDPKKASQFRVWKRRKKIQIRLLVSIRQLCTGTARAVNDQQSTTAASTGYPINTRPTHSTQNQISALTRTLLNDPQPITPVPTSCPINACPTHPALNQITSLTLTLLVQTAIPDRNNCIIQATSYIGKVTTPCKLSEKLC